MIFNLFDKSSRPKEVLTAEKAGNPFLLRENEEIKLEGEPSQFKDFKWGEYEFGPAEKKQGVEVRARVIRKDKHTRTVYCQVIVIIPDESELTDVQKVFDFSDGDFSASSMLFSSSQDGGFAISQSTKNKYGEVFSSSFIPDETYFDTSKNWHAYLADVIFAKKSNVGNAETRLDVKRAEILKSLKQQDLTFFNIDIESLPVITPKEALSQPFYPIVYDVRNAMIRLSHREKDYPTFASQMAIELPANATKVKVQSQQGVSSGHLLGSSIPSGVAVSYEVDGVYEHFFVKPPRDMKIKETGWTIYNTTVTDVIFYKKGEEASAKMHLDELLRAKSK